MRHTFRRNVVQVKFRIVTKKKVKDGKRLRENAGPYLNSQRHDTWPKYSEHFHKTKETQLRNEFECCTRLRWRTKSIPRNFNSMIVGPRFSDTGTCHLCPLGKKKNVPPKEWISGFGTFVSSYFGDKRATSTNTHTHIQRSHSGEWMNEGANNRSEVEINYESLAFLGQTVNNSTRNVCMNVDARWCDARRKNDGMEVVDDQSENSFHSKTGIVINNTSEKWMKKTTNFSPSFFETASVSHSSSLDLSFLPGLSYTWTLKD